MQWKALHSNSSLAELCFQGKISSNHPWLLSAERKPSVMLRTGENIELQAKDHMWVVSGFNDAHRRKASQWHNSLFSNSTILLRKTQYHFRVAVMVYTMLEKFGNVVETKMFNITGGSGLVEGVDWWRWAVWFIVGPHFPVQSLFCTLLRVIKQSPISLIRISFTGLPPALSSLLFPSK